MSTAVLSNAPFFTSEFPVLAIREFRRHLLTFGAPWRARMDLKATKFPPGDQGIWDGETRSPQPLSTVQYRVADQIPIVREAAYLAQFPR